MKVICIDNDSLNFDLTIDKIYDTITIKGNYYELISDIGEKHLYYTTRFVKLSEFREQQINSIFAE